MNLQDWLFGVSAELNTLAFTFYNFKVAQSIRLLALVILLLIWILTGFILVRISPFYLSFWATTFVFFSMLMTSLAAGRQVVEHKMLVKLNENQKEANKLLP